LYDQGRGKAFDTRVCTNCGFVYVPDTSRQDGDYRTHEKDDVSSETIERVLKAEKRARDMAERRFANIKAKAPDLVSAKGRLHDIGASLGFFMKCWSDVGFEVTGCEPDAYYARISQKHFGFDMAACLYEERPVETAAYDVITMCHVLEHVPDPRSTLKRIRTELRPDGKLYIEIPHIDRPYSGNLDRFFWAEHLNYFSLRTLDGLLRSEGFRISKSGGLGYFLWVVAEKGAYEQIAGALPLDCPDEIRQRTMVTLLHHQTREIKDLKARITALEKHLSNPVPVAGR
jgi:SAM-dependent methyltransferase